MRGQLIARMQHTEKTDNERALLTGDGCSNRVV